MWLSFTLLYLMPQTSHSLRPGFTTNRASATCHTRVYFPTSKVLTPPSPVSPAAKEIGFSNVHTRRVHLRPQPHCFQTHNYKRFAMVIPHVSILKISFLFYFPPLIFYRRNKRQKNTLIYNLIYPLIGSLIPSNHLLIGQG